jgi:hypothetical protein
MSARPHTTLPWQCIAIASARLSARLSDLIGKYREGKIILKEYITSMWF